MSRADLLFQTAAALHQAGSLSDAEPIYRQVLALEPRHGDTLRLLGGLYMQTAQVQAAIDTLARAAKRLPSDAETLTNYGLALRMGGRVDEAQKAFRRALGQNPDYIQALANLGGLYLDTGKVADACAILARYVNLCPDDAVAHVAYGNGLLQAGKVTDAIARYEHAVTLKADYIDAMVNLGMALAQVGQADRSNQWLGIARTWFEKALQRDPSNVVALNNLANVMRQQGDAEQAVLHYRKALAMKPDYGNAALNLATSLRDLGDYDGAFDSAGYAAQLMPHSADPHINIGSFRQDLGQHREAVASFDQALRLKPDSPDAKWNKSLSLLALGEYRAGWALHEIGLGYAHMRGDYPSPERRWRGESFRGKRLMIWSEQGFGDNLQFIRYAQMAKSCGGDVLVLCPPALRPLFANCPYIDGLPDKADDDMYDVHVPMMSLPYIFGTVVESIPAPIPYLHISVATQAKWRARFQPTKKLRVGLVWAGNAREQLVNAHRIDRRRSMSFDTLRPLFDVAGVDFYTLQIGAAAVHARESPYAGRMIDLTADIANFEDTGAIIENLDLVVTVDTSVAHLAGGLGKSVWILSRFDACWRWLQNRPDSPWYPSARIFGQKSPGDWDTVIADVTHELVRLSREAVAA